MQVEVASQGHVAESCSVFAFRPMIILMFFVCVFWAGGRKCGVGGFMVHARMRLRKGTSIDDVASGCMKRHAVAG